MNFGDTHTLVALTTLALLTGGTAHATTGAEAPQAPAVAIQQYDRALDASFSMGIAADGSAWTAIRAEDLAVDKWVAATGVTTMTLTFRKDQVTFKLTNNGYAISRGKRFASLSPTDRSENHREAVRSILLGSPAVRAFRALIAVIERREDDDTDATMATLIDGALIAMLDGDEGAVDRLSRRATRRARTNIRQAGATTQFNDCVGEYERSLLFALNDFEGCMSGAWELWWWSPIYTPFCALEYFMRSQQYIFQFISCLAIP